MADYGAQDTSTTSLGANQFPISEGWTPNAGFSAVEGGTQTTDAGGKKSAPVRIEVKDGSDVAQGLTTDPAVTGDNPGTLSAKLRGLVKILTDIWDSVNHRIKVDGSGVTQPVSGTFWQATQPVSLSSLPALAAGSAVIGHVINDTGSALIGGVNLVDSAGTNKAAIDSAGNQAMKGGFAEQTGLTAGSFNADLVPATDVSGYKSLSLQIDGTSYSGTLTFAWSNDGSNFYPLVMTRMDSNGSNTTTTTSLNAVGFCTNVFFHYFRVRMTSYTSGAAHGTLDLFTFPMTFVPVVDQGGTWTVQPGNTANTTPWLVSEQIGGAAISNTNPAPSQYVSQSGYISLSSPPSATNVGTDTTFTFSSQINTVIIQNNTAVNVNYAFDTAATLGSLLLLPGQLLVYSKKVTAIHLLTAAAQNVNGSSASNIVLLGEL